MEEFDDSDVEEIQLFPNVNNPSPAGRSPSDNSTSSVEQSKQHGRTNSEIYPQATNVPHRHNTGSTWESHTKSVVMQHSNRNSLESNESASSSGNGENITSLKRLHENETNSGKTLKRQKTLEEESDASKETNTNIHDEGPMSQINSAIKKESENNGDITDSHSELSREIGSGNMPNDSNALQNHEKSSLNMECPPIAIVSPLPDQSAPNPNSPDDDLDKLDAKILSDEDFDQSIMDDFPCSLDEMVNSIFSDKLDTFQTLDGSSWTFPDLQTVSIDEIQNTVNESNESVEVVKPSDQSSSPKETEKAPDEGQSSDTQGTYESTDQSNKPNPPVMYQTNIASIKKEQIPEHKSINNDSESRSVPVPNHEAKSNECSLIKKEPPSQIDLTKTDRPPVKSEPLHQIPYSSQGEPFSDFLQRYSPSYTVPTERITPPRSDMILRQSGYDGLLQAGPPNQIIPDLEKQLKTRRYGKSTSFNPFPVIQSISENNNFIMERMSHGERPRGPPVIPNRPTANLHSGMQHERPHGRPVFPNQQSANVHSGMQHEGFRGPPVFPNQQTFNGMQLERPRGPSVFPNQPTANLHSGMQLERPRGPPVFPNQPTVNAHSGMQLERPRGPPVFPNQPTVNVHTGMQLERPRGPPVFPNQPTANAFSGMQLERPRGPPVFPNQPTVNVHSGMQLERPRGPPVFPNQPTVNVHSGMQLERPRGPSVFPNQPTVNVHSGMQRFRPPHSSSMLPRQPFNQPVPMNQPDKLSQLMGWNSNVQHPRTMNAPNSDPRMPFRSNLPQHPQNSHPQLSGSGSPTANVQWKPSGQFNRSNQVLNQSPPASMFQANHGVSYSPLTNTQVSSHSLNRFSQAVPPVTVPPQSYAQGQTTLSSYSHGHHFTPHQHTMCSKNQPNAVGLQGLLLDRLPSSSYTAGEGGYRSQQEPSAQKQFPNQFHNNPSKQVAYHGERLSSSCDKDPRRHEGMNTSPKQLNDNLFSLKMLHESVDSTFINPSMVSIKERLMAVIRQSRNSESPTVKRMVGTFLQRVKHARESKLSDAERVSFVEETKKFIYDVTVLVKSEDMKQPQSPNTNSYTDGLIPILNSAKCNSMTQGDMMPCTNTYDNYNMQHTQTLSGNLTGKSIPQRLAGDGSSGNWTGLANSTPMPQYQSQKGTSLHVSDPFMDDIQRREADGTRGVGAQFGSPPQLWNMDGTAATIGSSVKQETNPLEQFIS